VLERGLTINIENVPYSIEGFFVDRILKCGYISIKLCTQREKTLETVGVKQLRDNLSRILKSVEKGAVVRVLRHGKDVVELRSITKSVEQDLVNRLRDKDLLGGGTGEIGAVKIVRNVTPEMPVSDFVIQDRR